MNTPSPEDANPPISAVRALFEAVCDLPEAEQEAVLSRETTMPLVVGSVRALLAADRRTSDADLQWRLEQCRDSIAASPGFTSGERLGAWRLLREIGHGGMGLVYLAERADGHYHQQAAIKLIRGRGDRDLAEHFQRERQLLANLQHPQIARLIDGGETPSGHPFLVMEYVDGVPLDQWYTENKPDIRTRLALFTSVCKVVQYAHVHRVVHCDLKPSNILVRPDGMPVLLDFGIAHALDPFAHAAHANLAVNAGTDDLSSDSRRLTPRYASPEQLRGETPSLASDIYSLGLMLYELASDDADARVSSQAPPALSGSKTAKRWSRTLTGDLDAIIACACAPDPERRYDSAAALADDISRIDQQLPVVARAPSWTYLAEKLLRRRWPAFVAGAVLLTVATGFAWRIVHAEHVAQREAATAQKAVDFLVSVFQVSDTDHHRTPRKDLTARQLLDSGAVRLRLELRDEPTVRARLLEALAHAYRHMGHSESSTKMLREAADLNGSPEVNDLPAAARCLEALTNALANGSFPATTVAAASKESLELAQRIHPADSQPIANALMVHSLALNRSGLHEAALAAAEASLAINLRRLPGNRLMPAWGNLSHIKTALGRYDEAYADNERAAELAVTGRISEYHRQSTRGGLQERMGRYDEALVSLRRAIAIEATFRDESSAYAVWARTVIGRALSSAGRYAEAQAELERALADQIALGEDAGELLTIRTDLARNRIRSGAPESALLELQSIRDTRLHTDGPDDPRTLSADANFAEARLASGDSGDETHELLLRVAKAWQDKSQTDTPLTLRARHLLARCKLERGDDRTASALLAKVDTLRERLPFRERLDVTALQARLALRQGNRSQARTLAQTAHRDYRSLLGDEDPATQEAARILSSLEPAVPEDPVSEN